MLNAAFVMVILDFVSCTPCIICYHATEAVEIHILQFFVISHNMYWGFVLEIPILLICPAWEILLVAMLPLA